MEISRGNEYEKLQKSLNKVFSICKLIWSDCENGHDIIKEYCQSIIQLSVENKIEKINKLSDELIEFVRDYENKCIESYSDTKNSIKEETNKIIQEANIFLN